MFLINFFDLEMNHMMILLFLFVGVNFILKYAKLLLMSDILGVHTAASSPNFVWAVGWLVGKYFMFHNELSIREFCQAFQNLC